MSFQTDLLVFDGNGMAYRFFSTAAKKFGKMPPPDLIEPSLPAVVPFHMVEMVMKVVMQFHARRIVLCWDSKGSWSRRQEIFPGYKGKRKTKTDEERRAREHYIRQLRMVQALFWVLGVDQVAGPGLEADDAVAWYAYRCRPEERAVMVAVDKDIWQLISPNVSVFDPFLGRLLTPENFTATIGLSQPRFMEYLALMGDKSDGVPGILRVGKKTAKDWLQQYASAEEIAASAKKPPQAAANLRAGLADVARNRQLIDLRWAKGLDTLPTRYGAYNPELALVMMKKWGMRPTVEAFGTVEGCYGTLWGLGEHHRTRVAAGAG